MILRISFYNFVTRFIEQNSKQKYLTLTLTITHSFADLVELPNPSTLKLVGFSALTRSLVTLDSESLDKGQINRKTLPVGINKVG